MGRSIEDMTGHVRKSFLAAGEQKVMEGPIIKQTTCYPPRVQSVVRHSSKHGRRGRPGGWK